MSIYTRSYTQWMDFSDTSTPITAAKLQNIDDGVYGAATKFNVMHPDYGAVGDGSTDDTAAIQAAIQAAADALGGIVWFPVGHYLITSKLDLSVVSPARSITLAGVGTGQRTPTSYTASGSSVIVNASGDTAIYGHAIGVAHPLSAVTIRDLQISNTVALPPYKFTVDCSGVIEQCVITGLMVQGRNLQGNGIRYATSNSNVYIANNTVHGFPGDGSAAMDAWRNTDGAMTASSATLTCATSTPFVVGDVGRTITVLGAGAAGADLVTTVAGYTSSSVVTLTVPASTSVTNAHVYTSHGGVAFEVSDGHDGETGSAIYGGGWVSETNGVTVLNNFCVTQRCGYLFRGGLQGIIVTGNKATGTTASHSFYFRGQSTSLAQQIGAFFISGNFAESFGSGGGSCAGFYLDVNCRGNVLTGNMAVSGSGAYGIFCDGAYNDLGVNTVGGSSVPSPLPVGLQYGSNSASNQGRVFSNGYTTTLYGDSSSVKNNTVSRGALSSHPTIGGIGYIAGAGSTVTQITSRTTGVEINTLCGNVKLVSAAGSTSWQTFTVTNSTVAATDTIILSQKSGTDLYQLHVTAVAAGSFQITYATTSGTTTEQPVFNFAVIKASAS